MQLPCVGWIVSVKHTVMENAGLEHDLRRVERIAVGELPKRVVFVVLQERALWPGNRDQPCIKARGRRVMSLLDQLDPEARDGV